MISIHHSDDKTKKAEVWEDVEADMYYVKYSLNDIMFLGEYYPGKSVHWAEDCAENYVLGIKNFDMDNIVYGEIDNECKTFSLHKAS